MRPGIAPDVGAAVAANLRLVPHAAERDADEFPPQRVGHALAQRRLAHAGRADEAEDRPLDLLLELDDRDELEQAVLHLAQAEMLFVEGFVPAAARSSLSSVKICSTAGLAMRSR